MDRAIPLEEVLNLGIAAVLRIPIQVQAIAPLREVHLQVEVVAIAVDHRLEALVDHPLEVQAEVTEDNPGSMSPGSWQRFGALDREIING